MVPSIAQSVAFGVGTSAEVEASTALQFEISRADILVTSLDMVNNRIIYKTSVPEDFGGKVYEAGIYSLPANSAVSAFGSRLITTFDSATEVWTTNSSDPVFTTANARIGKDSLNHVVAASATMTSLQQNIVLDFSENSAADLITFAFHNLNTNAASVTLRLKTDASNYYSFVATNPPAGYQVSSWSKGSATVNGTPNWGNITQIEVITVAKAAGAATVDFEGVRVEDVDTINPDYTLIAREVLSAPFEKQAGMAMEFEFSMDVNIT